MKGQRLPEGVSAASIPLHPDCPFAQITIRNGFLWGKNAKNQLVRVNLNNRANPKVDKFIEYGECEFYSVCPNGEMCYAKMKSGKQTNFVFTFDSLQPRPIDLLPNTIATSAAWLFFKNQSKPYLFIAVEDTKFHDIQLCYFNLNAQLLGCSPAMTNPPLPGKVIAFSLLQFENRKIGASFIIENLSSPCPYQLYPAIFKDETFLPVDDAPCQVAFLPLSGFNIKKNQYFIENQYIGINTPDVFYSIMLNPTKDVSIRNIHLIQNFNVDPHATNIFISNNVIFQLLNNQLSFFLINKNRNEDCIDQITLYDDVIFELDTYSSNLYSLSKDNILSNYQFSSQIFATGFDAFRFWLYFRLIQKQTKESLTTAAIILLQTSATFDQKFNLARNQSDSFRLEVFMKLLETVNEKYPVQKTVIAAMALDIYVRKETKESVNDNNEEEKEARMNEFIKWANHQINKKILTPSIIEKTLIQYNWNEALTVFLQPQAAFELNMQLGQYEEARKQLKLIQKSNVFSYSALRLHSLLSDDVVYKDVMERDDATSDGSLIPLMESEFYQSHLKSLFSAGRLMNHWLRTLFSLYMAKVPDTLCINQYFQMYPDDIEIMLRSLFSKKRYSEAAHGICSHANFQDLLPTAVGILSKVSPQEAFAIIPDDVPLPLKRRCALKILRSMKREDAEVVAQKSLLNSISGIDAATLIEFMPQTTTVGKVSKAIKRYVNRNLSVEGEEKKKSEEALEGIRLSNDLVEKREPQVVKLYKFSICERCGRPLLNEPAVVYPCSHALHTQCALELFNNVLFISPTMSINMNNVNNNNNSYYTNSNNNFSTSSFDLNNVSNSKLQIDLTADCPLCGFLCIKMINEPFEPNRDPSKDEWETDQMTLSKLLK
ncbi:tethering complex subunit [Tritrichomonas musculus]|uniref:Tethering complex subunit n=1 Tax=Tritrichomonas musculus TaxID=1915356 RepID=A0ABR2L021_9EUKA